MMYFVCPRILHGTSLFIWTHISMKLCLIYMEWQGPVYPVYLSEPQEWPWVFAHILGSALPTWLLFPLLAQWQVLTPTRGLPPGQLCSICTFLLMWWAGPLASDLRGCTTAGVQAYMDLFPGATNTTLWSFFFLDHVSS